MEAAPKSKERTELFQRLKPCCVKISQLAIRESDSPSATRELAELTNQILAILDDQVQRDPVVLDEKLAEYVFFPLYHIFRQMDMYPMSLIELGVKCLRTLIVYGWKSKISPKLVQQILSLVIFIIDGLPGNENDREIPEETVLESFRTLTALFTTAGSSAAASSGLAESEAIPALGHGVTVILEGVTDGVNPAIQHEALMSIQAVFMAIRDHGALANFLPGTVSALTKVLSSPQRHKTVVLSESLCAIKAILTRVLSDMRTRAILAKQKAGGGEEDAKKELLSPAWLKATVAQVRLALSSIMKLRTHAAPEVRDALKILCVTLLDECHTTLSNSANFLVETAMVLDTGSERQSITETTLGDLVNIYPELGETVKTTVYNWMSSLPRIMQASDEDVKETSIHNLSQGVQLMRGLQLESSTIDDSMPNTLRDSIMSLVLASKSQNSGPTGTVQLLEDTNQKQVSTTKPQYLPVLLAHDSQKRMRKEMLALIKSIGSASQQRGIAADMLETLQESNSVEQVAAFWLCFELIKASRAASAEVEDFMDLSAFTGPSEDSESVFNELYAYSVQVLDSHSDASDVDWRLEALALEVTAYAAESSGLAFRPELIDVLFPIATFLGSDNPGLQQHAIATLNGIASACQYETVSELIIDNVDYMVNSVALRLNTLDISPASTKVLAMMIRLAGPRLIPFLDDVVESIFAALENYHGYPAFVESLFAVLKETVNQGVRSDMLLLEDQKNTSTSHKKQAAKAEGLQSIVDYLDAQTAREKRDEEELQGALSGHPQTPWRSEAANGEDDENPANEASGEPPEKEKPPNSPTYQLLLRVTTLTQHYLTSPTPKLRRSLLELLTTASSALAADEEAFLPLVNAIWPVVIGRLHDPETYIVVEACHTLSGLCEAAGDFLSSRFKTEWADGLRDWSRRAKQQASSGAARGTQRDEWSVPNAKDRDILIPIRSADGIGAKAKALERTQFSGGLGQHASPVRIWEAVVKLLTSIVSYVAIDDYMFDEILDLLSDVMERNGPVREALETINPDAVWLARYEKGLVEPLDAPEVEGMTFVKLEEETSR